MVGKPNFPVDMDSQTELKGAAMVSSNLDALDQEREASMADEGGASGALMENQDDVHPMVLDALQRKSDSPDLRFWMTAIGVGVLVGAGTFLISRSMKRGQAA